MKREFTMTDDDLESLLTASQPELVWYELGQNMGFDPSTVEPIDGENLKRFKAEPVYECKGCGRPSKPGFVCDICSMG